MLALSETNVNYYIYIIRCKDGSLYTGYTRNIKRRIFEHNFSKWGAKSIKGRLPVELVYSETYTTKAEALRREIEIKGWNRKKKLALIKNAHGITSDALALTNEVRKRE
ncbi:MAG: GIY-YIG nuclease family protein [Candidatus Levybacteria bacterium]|nr:GIY-YIG nuclease family protein [Candidatus Levybacteria bacterium]